MKQVSVLGYMVLLLLLVLVTLTGCYQKPEFEDPGREGRQARTQINRYYSSLSEASLHPIEMNGVVLPLKQEGNQKSALITHGIYLFTKGYRVQAISEPMLISYEKPFATYTIDVEVEYPKDPFISARVCNFEYEDK
ncbi:hypothetical protein [Brevibacillus sp. SYSU BS000544]|uniref:hypothetical protein n=1 Tax=Brevibacillus sp. SYSU BS000544 TaxID=3416443 RepID=UPI003CE4F836